MKDWLRIWSKLDEPVSRRTYLSAGLSLAALKYGLDAALIWFGAGVPWTPWDYFVAGASWGQSPLAGAPSWLLAALGVSTLPFVSVGLTLSIRRALDAGISPWLGLTFFVPVLNYAFMAAMCVLPSRARSIVRAAETAGRSPNTLSAVVGGSLLCLALVAFFVLGVKSYGAALFFGVPITVGAVTAYIYNRGAPTTWRDTLAVVVGALALSGVGLVGVAVEGAICILMAAPLGIVLAALGARAGRDLALIGAGIRGAALVVLGLPMIAPLDRAQGPQVHEVISFVEIDAPPDWVWNHVVSFSTLPPPNELVFRAGIAHPIRARIVGSGVGAVRYCEFSTGAFVEPITHWEPGRRLSFGVTDHPPPMREWSPYHIAPPHLEGWFAAQRGEFRLVALPGGRTRLEGSTWYTLHIQPTPYWAPMADALVHTIHQRVLRHIKGEAERETRRDEPPVLTTPSRTGARI